jgi:large subunit ribosomal protein L19e
MTIATVRRLAADIMRVGENKIKINPEGVKEAEGALTRSDVKGLIEKGIIRKDPPQGRASTKRVGRTGHGRRRGTPIDHKTAWMMKIRAQRNVYQMLIASGDLKQENRRAVYSKIKSGMLRSKRALLIYLKEANMVRKDLELPKTEYNAPVPSVKKAAKPKAAPAQKAVAVQQKPAEHKKEEPRKAEHKPEHKQEQHIHGGEKPMHKGERK